MSENWTADARVGVPMFQVIAKQVSQYKHRPRAVRQIIDQQWLDEAAKQQLRESFYVTDADLSALESADSAGDRSAGLDGRLAHAPEPDHEDSASDAA
jgi:hypothetical protein